MDPVISSYEFVKFMDNLNYCKDHGIVYQNNDQSIDYGKEYFENYVQREGTDIAKRLNRFRTELTERYCKVVLDIGIGSGEFIKSSSIKAYGYDVNPYGVEFLKERNIFVDPYKNIPSDVKGFCFWDTMEHIAEPSKLIEKFKAGSYLFISLPIFNDFEKLKASKHFKPKEHLIYFSEKGLEKFLIDCNCRVLETSNAETNIGREGVLTFTAKKE